MAQSTDFEPPTPFFLNIAGSHPQTRSQDLASILKDVVIDQNGNSNPSHHTVLLLMELRANLENRYDFPNACQAPEPDSVIWAIDEAMHLSLQFLQRMTDLNGNFEPLVTSSLHLAELILHTVDTSELGDPDAVTIVKQLRKQQKTDMLSFTSALLFPYVSHYKIAPRKTGGMLSATWRRCRWASKTAGGLQKQNALRCPYVSLTFRGQA